MSPSSGRPPPRTSTGDPARAGTPAATRPLPTRAELRSYLDGETGPVKSADEARHWLETKGWILAAEPYERTKLVCVLLTAALSKGSEIKGDVRNAILSVAYLLEENVEDTLSNSLADKFTEKVIHRVEHATQRLSSAADFASATDTSRAEATLALKTVADQLLAVSSNLDKITDKLATPPQHTVPTSQSSWAAIIKTNTPRNTPVSTNFNPAATEQQTRVQQHALQLAKTVILDLDDESPLITDRSPASVSQARDRLNKELANHDLDTNFTQLDLDGNFPDPVKTYIRGITVLKNNTLRLEFNSADSASRFRNYANDSTLNLLDPVLGPNSRLKSRPNIIIARFVPCDAFDPQDDLHIAAFESDNGLPAGSITSAHWLKRIKHRAVNQTVASVKLNCDTPETANILLTNHRVYAAGHLIAVCRDIREPLRCNKCQQYGHVRASCKHAEACATCTSPDHTSTDCPTDSKPQCISCGPTSDHPSYSRNCPAFKKCSEDLRARHPDNLMPLFPTGDPSTWIMHPAKQKLHTPTAIPSATSTAHAPSQASLRQATLLDMAQRCLPSQPSSLDNPRSSHE